MKKEVIAEIGIDDKGRLFISPATAKFPSIYREAMDVHWDEDSNYLFGAELRHYEWSWGYIEWFKQIIAAAKKQSIELVISEKTKWINVPDNLQKEILSL